jgi:hypothetical protein
MPSKHFSHRQRHFGMLFNIGGLETPDTSYCFVSELFKGNTQMIMSLEGRQAVSRAQRGKVLSPEHIAAIRAANTGRKQSLEHIAKRAAARIENTRRRKALLPPKERKPYKKKLLTQEHKDRIAAANTGKHHTNETKERLRQINLKRAAAIRPLGGYKKNGPGNENTYQIAA